MSNTDAGVIAFGEAVAGLANAMRGAGLPVPPVSQAAGQFFVIFPDVTLGQDELRFLLDYAGGDLTEVLEAVPAERVSAEISGAWYEVRAALPLVQQIGHFLNDDRDDPAAEAADFLNSLLSAGV